jgi:hypothetical protein
LLVGGLAEAGVVERRPSYSCADGQPKKESAVTLMLGHFDVGDFDTWKREVFDADPAGRRQAARGHILSRSVDNPNEVFVRVEFNSVEDAKAFRERLLDSGALDRVTVKTPPTVVEVAEEVSY